MECMKIKFSLNRKFGCFIVTDLSNIQKAKTKERVYLWDEKYMLIFWNLALIY